MAQKRMISKKITNTDAFLDMPVSSQNLYFHLNLDADDDGFVSSPKRIMRMIGATEDDYKILLAKRFILTFENQICVIKHWLIHNTIQKDRYEETKYLDEKNLLCIKENKAYSEGGKHFGNISETQIRLDKIRLDKNRIEESRIDKIKNKKLFFEEQIKKDFPQVSKDLLEEFVKMRKRTKGVDNERTWKSFLNEISKLQKINNKWDIIFVIEFWLEKEWKSFKADWVINTNITKKDNIRPIGLIE